MLTWNSGKPEKCKQKYKIDMIMVAHVLGVLRFIPVMIEESSQPINSKKVHSSPRVKNVTN
jgi:hypothetical protein